MKIFLFKSFLVSFKINNFTYVIMNYCSHSKFGDTRSIHHSKNHCCGSQFKHVTVMLLNFEFYKWLNWLIDLRKLFFFSLYEPCIYAKVFMNCNRDGDFYNGSFYDGISSKPSVWWYRDTIIRIKSDFYNSIYQM